MGRGRLKFYEMFAGIGGFRLGLERAGMQYVGGCENWQPARDVYKHNFGKEPTQRDVTKVNPKQLPDFDLLCAGFPCQPFSTAGNRKGFADIRGTMWNEIKKHIEAKTPAIILLENVEGLRFHDKGRTMLTILLQLEELGYCVQWQVIDARYFVPQARQRVFIVGYFGKICRRAVFPVAEPVEESAEQQCSKSTIVMLAHTKANMKQRVQQRCNTWTLDTSGHKFGIVDEGRVRRLTPLECERLMGFPDNWTAGAKDSQRYHMLGNAVVPAIVEMIGRLL